VSVVVRSVSLMTTTATPTPAGLVAVALEAIRPLLVVDWTEVPVVEQAGVVEGLQQVASVQGAVTTTIAGRLAAGSNSTELGWASAQDYLTSVVGGHKGSGPGLVRLAQRLETMPDTAAALQSGCLSVTKAQVIAAKVASLPLHQQLREAAEQALLESARALDATELARTWPSVLEAVDPDGTLLGSELSLERQERAAHRQRTAAFGEDGRGGGWFKVTSTLEDIAIVKETLLPLAKPVLSEPGACGGVPGPRDWSLPSGTQRGPCPDSACGHDGSDPRDHGARLVDALVEACRRGASAGL